MQCACPHCNKQIYAPPEAAGRIAKCKGCGGRFKVPIPTAVESGQPSVAVSRDPMESPPESGKVHVIAEKTSKQYKALQITGLKVILFSFVTLYIGSIFFGYSETKQSVYGISSTASEVIGFIVEAVGYLGIVGGICVILRGRYLAWWHHG